MPDDASRPVRAARGRRSWRASRYVLLLVTCALVANALGGESGLLATLRASLLHESFARGIAALKEENAALSERARRLREDPGFIEDLARRELRLMRPGEQVFIVRPAEPAETDPRATDSRP